MGKSRKTSLSKANRIRHANFYKKIRKEKEEERKQEEKEEKELISMLVAEEEEKEEIISSLVEEKEEFSSLWTFAHEGWTEERKISVELGSQLQNMTERMDSEWEKRTRAEEGENKAIKDYDGMGRLWLENQREKRLQDVEIRRLKGEVKGWKGKYEEEKYEGKGL